MSLPTQSRLPRRVNLDPARARRTPYCLTVERLEDRTLLAGHTLATATSLSFFNTTPVNTATASAFLDSSTAVDLYAVTLKADDQLTATLAEQSIGSGLIGYLRLFNSGGQQMFAVDEPNATDAPLTVQVQNAGTYYVGVSVSGNNTYDPTTASATGDTSQTGLYTLNLSRPATPPAAQSLLVGSQFQVTSGPAVWSQLVSVSYQIDNRGAAASGPFMAQVVLASSSAFSGTGLYGSPLTTVGPFNLAADANTGTQMVNVTLPAQPPGFPATGPVYLGLKINGTVGPDLGAGWNIVNILPIQNEAEPNNTSATANTLTNLNGRVNGSINPAGDVDFYKVVIPNTGGPITPTSGELTAQLQPTAAGLLAQLTLYDASGKQLQQSDGVAGGPTAQIVQSLPAATYYLEVQGVQGGTGGYTLTTQFVAGPLLDQVTTGFGSGGTQGLVVGDFNNDGRLDAVAIGGGGNGLNIWLGNGDGTFQNPLAIALPYTPESLVTGDFNGDGKLDILVIGESLSLPPPPPALPAPPKFYATVLLGNGDGTFQAKPAFLLGTGTFTITTGDFNDDGSLDLVVTDVQPPSGVGVTTGSISWMQGNGDGTFQAPQTIFTGVTYGTLLAADFNGDGNLDLIGLVSSPGAGGIASIFFGNGNGTFRTPQPLPFPGIGSPPWAPTFAGDFNGDGKLDVYGSAPGGPNNLGGYLLLGNGNGTFQTAQATTFSGLVGDFTGDGHLDVLTTNDSGPIAYLSDGKGNFQQAIPSTSSAELTPSALGDFNGDGRLDFVTFNSSAPLVVSGNGDGTFQVKPATSVSGTVPLVSGDFNGDGNLDITDGTNVFLGNGNGNFQIGAAIPGSTPLIRVEAMAAGDFNGDGRLDLAISEGGILEILLGNGDGTFRLAAAPTLTAPSSPFFFPPVGSIVTGDFNGDGHLDIAVAGLGGLSPAIDVLLSNGDGTFHSLSVSLIGLPATPYTPTLLTGDFTNDGHLDLVLELSNGTLGAPGGAYLLLGNANGTFQAPQALQAVPSGYSILGIAAGNFTKSGFLDLVTVSAPPPTMPNATEELSFLRGQGNGTFAAPSITSLNVGFGIASEPTLVGDFNGDSNLDFVFNSSLVLGNGDGTFQAPQALPANESNPVAGDFNNDGRLDIAGEATDSQTIPSTFLLTVFLNQGGGSLVLASNLTPPDLPVPLLATLSNPTVPDAVIVNDAGAILYRAAQPQNPGTYAAPLTVNPDTPARAIAIVSTALGTRIAAVNQSSNSITLYALDPDGISFAATLTLPTFGTGPSLILAANLTGNPDGQDHDLIIYNALSGTLSIFLSDGMGGFLTPSVISVGLGGSSLALAPVSGGPPSILLTNQTNGQITELFNDGTGHFSAARSQRFLATSGPFSWDTSTAGVGPVLSYSRTIGAAAGAFNTSSPGATDIAVVNAGSNTLSILFPPTNGSYLNPVVLPLPFSPGYVVAADFNHDGNLDLAILDPLHDLVCIYLGDGHGHFTFKASYSAGNDPTGITVADVTRPGGGAPDGNLDLLIGNTYGDILVLPG